MTTIIGLFTAILKSGQSRGYRGDSKLGEMNVIKKARFDAVPSH